VVLIRDGSGAAPFYWVDERDPLVARVVHSTRRPDDGVVLSSIVAGEEVVVAEVR
jgi:hypothetical protein